MSVGAMDTVDARAADLDDVDLELLERVETDFDVNLEELSEDLGLSKSAVHYRLSKLREAGVIEGVSADLDPLAFGLNMAMITDVRVTHEEGYSEEVGAALASVSGVLRVYYTMGDVDFVVVSRLQDRDGMNRVIDDIVAIDGVNSTSSRFVMKEIKTDDRALANMSEDMRQAILDQE
jgi:Lrp/AsnC family leucine-responsive transcriptional regulator